MSKSLFKPSAQTSHLYTPRFFEYKRYTLVVVCFVDILILIAYAAMSGMLADELLTHIVEQVHGTKTDSGRTIVIVITVCMCVGSIFFEFVGIIGALMESFKLVVIYFVGAAAEFLIRVLYSVYDVEFSGLLAWEVVTLVVTLLYAYDLRLIRKREAQQSVKM